MTTLTCWQVHIEGKGWKYIDPKMAAFCVADATRRGVSAQIRLDDMPVPPTLKFDRWPKPVDCRDRAKRLRNAERKLARDRDKVALFAEQLAAEQPTPEERVQGFDDQMAEHTREQRKVEASRRREARAAFARLPEVIRARTLLRLEQWFGPRDGFYALWLMNKEMEAAR